MPIIVQDARAFTAERPWGARDLAEIDGATVRLHWSDQPYKWHVNDGAEVFLVIEGQVDMLYREAGVEKSVRLGPSDMFIAQDGDAHVAHPVGEARILVIERKGSI
jgi:mannose-6-phosphate isomerase-like protein (cupin superfamily)